MKEAISIRNAGPQDEAEWRKLWAGYNQFYESSVPEPVTARTWQRVLDPASPLFARLAVGPDGALGFSISVVHEGTWTVDPICYLEDLFVEPTARGQGLGRLLIQDLVDLAGMRGWSRLYWHTQSGNPARKLYDEFVMADDFVRYRMFLR